MELEQLHKDAPLKLRQLVAVLGQKTRQQIIETQNCYAA
jgi:hypothetical protein